MKLKEKENEEEATHIEDTQRSVTEEIEMLKVVLYLVCRIRRKKMKLAMVDEKGRRALSTNEYKGFRRQISNNYKIQKNWL